MLTKLSYYLQLLQLAFVKLIIKVAADDFSFKGASFHVEDLEHLVAG